MVGPSGYVDAYLIGAYGLMLGMGVGMSEEFFFCEGDGFSVGEAEGEYEKVTRDVDLWGVEFALGIAPTGSAALWEIHRSANVNPLVFASIASFSVNASQATGMVLIAPGVQLNAGDVLRLWCTQIGSVIPGANMRCRLRTTDR